MHLKMLHQLSCVCILLCLIVEIASYVTDNNYIVHPDFDQCTQKECDKIDSILKENVDLYTEPCDDFFKYSRGNNIENKSGIYNKGSEKLGNLKTFRELLDGTFVNYDTPNEAFEIEKRIFANCKSSAYSPNEVAHYQDLLEHYYANTFYTKYISSSDSESWLSRDAVYAKDGFGFSFFDIDVVEEKGLHDKPKKRFIQISPTSDNVLDMNDLLTTKYIMNAPNGYETSFNSHSTKKYEELKRFISELHKIVPFEQYDDVETDDHVLRPITLSKWQEKYDNFVGHDNDIINWRFTLSNLFEAVQLYELDSETPVIVKDENYFWQLAKVLRGTQSEVINNYVHLRFISKTIGFVEERYKEKYSIIPHVKGLKCTPGLLVGSAYVYTQRFFPNDNRITIQEIFRDLKRVINTRLGSIEYNPQANSEVTKSFLRKLSSANEVYGYENWLENEEFINSFYSGFSASGSYIDNQRNVISAMLRKKLRSYVDYKIPLFDMKVFFKSFTLDGIELPRNFKQIVFPVRVFSEDNYVFLSTLLYNPINYGAAGTTIASEIYLSWLRRIAYADNATQCVTTQVRRKTFRSFDKMTADEYLLKSTAYLLGLRTAYDAWPNKDSYPIQFKNFGAVTDYRLFFLSFAESMFRKVEGEENEKDISNMVNFVVSNLNEFAEAFQCYKTHKMNKKHKCDPLIY